MLRIFLRAGQTVIFLAVIAFVYFIEQMSFSVILDHLTLFQLYGIIFVAVVLFFIPEFYFIRQKEQLKFTINYFYVIFLIIVFVAGREALLLSRYNVFIAENNLIFPATITPEVTQAGLLIHEFIKRIEPKLPIQVDDDTELFAIGYEVPVTINYSYRISFSGLDVSSFQADLNRSRCQIYENSTQLQSLINAGIIIKSYYYDTKHELVATLLLDDRSCDGTNARQ